MDLLSWIFFGPAKLIGIWPFAGVPIACALIAAQLWQAWRCRESIDIGQFRKAPLFAGLLWLIFNAYELQIGAISLRTNAGMIRLDLVVLVPILYVLTVAALFSLASKKKIILPQQRDSE
jgi:hypothetical protein